MVMNVPHAILVSILIVVNVSHVQFLIVLIALIQLTVFLVFKDFIWKIISVNNVLKIAPLVLVPVHV